jgi:hypothetical protein
MQICTHPPFAISISPVFMQLRELSHAFDPRHYCVLAIFEDRVCTGVGAASDAGMSEVQVIAGH